MTYTGYAVVKVTNNTNTDLTDFQVKLTLDSNNFQYWDALRDDGIDIYFTLSDGLTEVPFWRESFDKANKQATFWIKVPSVAANSYTTLYMYFGNSNETTDRSNGTQVFEFFDDFDSLGNWTVIGNTATANNSQLTLTAPDFSNRVSVYSSFSVTPNPIGYIIGVKATGAHIVSGFILAYGNGTGYISYDLPNRSYIGGFFRNSNTTSCIGKCESSGFTSLVNTSVSAEENIANYVEFGWYSNILVSRDFTHNIQLKTSDSTFSNFDCIHISISNGIWIFDYIYVRKYITNSTNIDEVDPLFEPLTATIEDVKFTQRTISATLILNNVQQYIDTFVGDGSTTVFTLSKKPIIPKVRVFIDGIEVDETKIVVDYTSGMITLSTAPASNSTVSIVYYYGDCDFIPNATVKVLINDTEIDSVTTDQYGRYTVKIPMNVEVRLKAETDKFDSITVVKLTE